MRSTRRAISIDARREKVIKSMRCGSAPLTIRWATRWARVLVLPEPAPAMTSSGPPTPPGETPCSTARRWSGLSASRYGACGMKGRRRRVGTASQSDSRFVRNAEKAGAGRPPRRAAMAAGHLELQRSLILVPGAWRPRDVRAFVDHQLGLMRVDDLE